MPTEFNMEEMFPEDLPESDRDVFGADEDDPLWTLLSVYADGEATPEEAAQVEALLRSDPAYARDLSFLQMSAKTVQTLGEVEPPVSLRDSILDATSRRKSVTQRVLAWCGSLAHSLTAPTTMRAAFATAAAAVLLLGLFLSQQ